jgi:S1-C subfamily serine protease
MKYLLAVLAAALLLTVAVPTQSSTASLGIAREYVRQLQNCSAVAIAPGFLLTADHCVSEDRSTLVLRPGGPAPTVLARGDDRLDYALLVYPAGEVNCPCATLASSDAERDETTYIIGYPYLLGQVVTIGLSQGIFLNERMPFGRRLVTAAQVAGGNSGGGTFVVRDGEFQLVGILVEGSGPLSFSVPLADLRPFLELHLPRPRGL